MADRTGTDDEQPTDEHSTDEHSTDEHSSEEPSTDPSSTVAVVLAAGGGSRFGAPGHKLLAELDGRPIAERAIRAALDAEIGPVLVITGATSLDELDPVVLSRVVRSRNEAWAEGQHTSLAVGLTTADRRWRAGAVVVGLADQPFVVAEAWRAVAASHSPIAVATYDGARRHPVRLDRSVWPLLTDVPDAGARELIRLRPDLVEEIPCPGSGADIDTVEELRSWQNRSSTNSP